MLLVLFCEYSANGQNPSADFIVLYHVKGTSVTKQGVITSVSAKGAKEDTANQFVVCTCGDEKMSKSFAKLQWRWCSSQFKRKGDKGGLPSFSAFVGM